MPSTFLRSRRLAACALLFALASPAVLANQPPVFTSTPPPVADVGHVYAYDATATDADGQPLRFELVQSPEGMTLDATSGALRWAPATAQTGVQSVALRVSDGAGGNALQSFSLRVREDFCPIYPIALPASVIATLQPGARVAQLERGTGAGNFSWLSWSGAVDAPTLAQSLQPPGDSDTYVGPTNPADRLLEIGDFAQGATGSMNARDVRERLDALIGQDIVLPVWDQVRGQGARFDYRVQRFALVRLTDYRLTGQGWIGFEYRGEARCYDDPPTATGQALQTPEDTPLALTLRGTDPDGDALTYQIVDSPRSGTLSGGDGAARTYVPAANWHGEDGFTFRVFDGHTWSAPAEVTIEVTPVNDAPTAQDQNVVTDEDTAIEFTLQADDVEHGVLAWELLEAPQHGELSGDGAARRYVPAPNYHGPDQLRYRVSDGEASSRIATVPITVRPVNDPPRIVSTAPTRARDGERYAYPAEALDADVDDVLGWSLRDGPDGLRIDPLTGLVEWTPSAAQTGVHQVEIAVRDRAAATDAQRFEISVETGNLPPQIISPPLQSVAEHETYRYDVDAVDPNPADVLRYDLTQAPASMVVDSESGSISWTPDPALTGSNLLPHALCLKPGWSRTTDLSPAAADLVVVVDISGSMSEEHAWIGDFAAPLQAHLTTNGIGSGNVPNQFGLVTYHEWPETVLLGGKAFGNFVQLEAATSSITLRGGEYEDGWRAMHHGLSSYPLRSKAATNVILITDEDHDIAPNITLKYEDMLAAFGQRRAMLNAVVNAQLRCGDGSVAMGLAPDGIGYKADGGGGYVTCTGARVHSGAGNTEQDYIPLALATGGAAWDINQLRKGGLTAQSFTSAFLHVKVKEITEQFPAEPVPDAYVASISAGEDGAVRVRVGNRGRAPMSSAATLVARAGGQEFARVNVPAMAVDQTVELDLAWTRPAEPILLEATLEAPGDDCAVDNNRAVARWVEARVRDPRGLEDRQAFSVSVTDISAAPVFTSVPPLTASVAGRYEYAARASDPDRGDAVEYSVRSGPLGLRIDRLTGLVTFIPEPTQLGSHAVVLVARDLGGAEAEQAFTLSIGEAYVAPRFTSTAPFRAIGGTLYEYQTAVRKDPAAQLSYDVYYGPPGLTVDAQGRVTWLVPDPYFKKKHRVLLRVRDQAGNYDLHNFVLFGDYPNAAPSISGTPPTHARVGRTYLAQFDAVDVNVLEETHWRLDFAPSTARLQTSDVWWDSNNIGGADPESELKNYNRMCRLTDFARTASLVLSPASTTGFAKPAGQVLVAPLADSNFDGRYDHRDAFAVVTISQKDSEVNGARLHAFDLRTRARYWSYNARVPNWYVSPAIGRLRPDDGVSVLFVDAQSRLVSVSGYGREQWVSEVAVGAGSLRHNAISLADLEGDGVAEILIGPSVFDADGRLRWSFPPSTDSQSPSLAVDLDGDGRMEVLYRNEARDAAGALLWRTPSGDAASYGSFAPLALQGGGMAFALSERVGTEARLALLRADGTPLWSRNDLAGSAFGTPLVGDFDRDGRDDVFLPANGALYEQGGAPRWTAAAIDWGVQSYRAAVSGDFDRDGYLEIAGYANEGLALLAGPTGALMGLDDTISAGGMFQSLPIMVDVAGDGAAALLVGSNLGWRQYWPQRGQWASQARAFHQHAWAADRLDPDLRVAAPAAGAVPQPTGRFAQSVGAAPITTHQSDLLITAPYTSGTVGEVLDLHTWVTNRGTRASLPFKVEFHRGTPSAPNGLIATREVAALGVARSTYVSASGLSRDSLGTGELFAVIVADPQENECETRNNRGSSRYFQLSLRDYGGLQDVRGWVVRVIEHLRNPSFQSSAPTTASEGQPYVYPARGSSTYPGDALTYALTAAPAGASVDSETGQVRWTPRWGQSGTFNFSLRTTTQQGSGATQSWIVKVTPSTLPNTAPVFDSVAPLHATLGQVYAYSAHATDAEGHDVGYALTQAPAGMQIDPESGTLYWIPTSVPAAPVPVTLTATDERGASTTQSFSITTHALPNRAPAFTSLPSPRAFVEQRWSYAAQVTDPDGDALTMRLLSGPAGLDLDAATRTFAWQPAASQLGPHEVEIEVLDGRGGYARQRFTLTVEQVAAGNHAPTLAGTPASQAVVDRVYTYQPTAADADGDTLQFSLTAGPSGATAHAASGAIAWTPTAAQIGAHDFTLRVDDGRGGWATQSFSVSVVAAGGNAAPVITSIAPTSVALGATYTYGATATDADGDALSWRLAVAPAGMQVNAATGIVSWLPRPEQVGAHAVAIEVTDGRSPAARQDFTLTASNDGSGGNRPPTLLSAPVFAAKVGRNYVYPVQAFDADGDTLIYSLTAAPEGMAVDAAGRIAWTPTAAGPASVSLRVADARAYVEQHWTIEVASADTPLTATVIVAPQPATPGAPITITVDVDGAGGTPTATASLDGVPVTVVPEGETTINAPTAPGVHPLVVRVSDGTDTVETSETVLVADLNDTAAPGVSLLSPDFDAEVTAPIDVRGEVTGSDVVRWTLSYQDLDSGALETLQQGNGAVAAQTLGAFDPTQLLNGQYQLVLQAWDSSGNRAVDSRPIRVTGDLKLGHYSVTFEDVSIPLAGIPIQVTRTYDTRRRKQSLDFGHGWTVDASNLRVHESRRVGYGWSLNEYSQGFFSEWCVQPNGDPIVTVTLPDGEVMSFRAKASPECQFPTPRVDVAIVFEPIDGTDGTLSSADVSNVRLVGSNLVDLSDPQLRPVDLSNYKLTTTEGIVYEVNQFTGLKKVSEPDGQFVTYSRDGVRHSSGIGVDFIRDPAGRITEIHRPDNAVLRYDYDDAGDLVVRHDAEDETATFGYHPRMPHYLETIEDARSILVSRNEYDEVTGRLTATVDGEGRRIEFTHDVGARVSRVKDRRGNTTVYTYDDSGRVLTETNALNETIRHTYDGDGNELTRTDPLNRTTTWTYDSRGNALTEKNHANETTTSTWNGKNQLLTQKDPAQRLVLDNRYSGTGLDLLETKDALLQPTSFVYDRGIGTTNTGNVATITDAEGGTTGMEYDPFTGFQGRETDALLNLTTMRHDAMGRRTHETRRRTLADGSVQALVTVHDYDDEGRLESTTHPDGSVTTLTYEGLDQPRFECDALQRCVEHVYNARGEETDTRYPDGTSESRSYDPNGNVLTQTDRAGRTTRFVYDAANRLTFTIHPDETPDNDEDNPRSQNVYVGGQLERSIDERGHVTRYEYDAAGRRTHVHLPVLVDGETAMQVEGYDSSGRRTSSTDALNRRTEYVYDAAGRLREIVHPDSTPTLADNPRTRYEYDRVGRKTVETDEMGRTTRYAYDRLGRLVAVVLPHPVTGANPPLVDGVSPDSGTLTTRYAYDEVGNKISQTDAENRTTRWEYDAMGRETARVLPEGQRETRLYNDAGELESHTDFNDRTTNYRYDDAGRLDIVDYPTDPDVDYGYNGAGERITVLDGRGNSTREYDARSRVRYATDADGGRIEYQYDDAGNLRARISPSQSLVYEYDERNRLKFVVRTVDGEAPVTTRYEYYRNGSRKAMVGGDGIRTEYTYDVRNRLRDLIKKTAAGAVMLSMTYTVDASGMRSNVVERDTVGIVRSVTWGYDKVRRLTSEVIDHRTAAQDRSTTWTYDKVGNRRTQTLVAGGVTETTTYTYDDNDRLETESRVGGSAAGTTTYAYDDNGNTLGKTGPGGATIYRYDDANRLSGATTPEGEVAYVYDAAGLRVRQTFTPNGGTATTTWYVQDTVYPYAQVVEEYTSQGSGAKTLAATFTFADELVSQTRYTNGTPTTRFIQFDGFGSTRWLTDTTGAITDKVDHDAFGVEISRTGTTAIEHLYRGEAFDPNVGFYYLRARWMNPSSGRFVTQDVWRGRGSDPASLHKYAYANSEPVNGIDPLGLYTMADVNAALTIQDLMSIIRADVGRQVRGAAFKKLGTMAQEGVAKLAREVTEEIIEEIALDAAFGFSGDIGELERFDGNKRRFIDFVAEAGEFVADIEVKYGVPKAASSAMTRLVSQARSMRPGRGASRVLLLFSENVSAADLRRLRRALREGKAGPVQIYHGSESIRTYFRNFFVNAL